MNKKVARIDAILNDVSAGRMDTLRAREQIIAELFPESDRINRVIEYVCQQEGVTKEQITGKRGGEDVEAARHIAAYLLWRLGYSKTAIARALNKSHSTVIHSINTIRDRMNVEKPMLMRVSSLEEAVMTAEFAK